MKRVVIVDDQADIRRLLHLTLAFGAYHLYEAADGDEALQMASEIRPEVMILDVMMPGGVDGLEVCRRVRADPELAGTRVVMLSARGQQSDIVAGEAAGCDAYIVKPFSPLELAGLIERLTAVETAPCPQSAH